MWFKDLMGFIEESPQNVYKQLSVEGDKLTSIVNGRSYTIGTLEVPSLAEFRSRNTIPNPKSAKRLIKISEVVGNVQQMHADPKNKGAIFQAASQFNLLEMVDPSISPAMGVNRYENDYTQGPACAIACGAGTIYRNYFAPVESQIGQTNGVQIDCLSEIGDFFGNEKEQLWKMSNGYALANQEGILFINKTLAALSPEEYFDLQGKLKVGIQWNTEVTYKEAGHKVSQVYCSALPVAYSHIESYYWDRFACLVLSATYEATLYAAFENYQKTGNSIVYLTLVGGGAFGNDFAWIEEAIVAAVNKFAAVPLDIRIVSFGTSKTEVRSFCEKLNG